MTPQQALQIIGQVLQRPATVYNGLAEAQATADAFAALHGFVEQHDKSPPAPEPAKKRKG